MARKAAVKTTSRDPVTKYARAVCAGKILAGPHVRDACARHLRDLEDGPKRGLHFDVKAVERAVGYFQDVLRLNGGEFEGVPYALLGWQAFTVGSLFGWKQADGSRRFRVAYVETAKGSGKSPLAAGIGHYGLTADSEPRAEIYAAATKKDQAMILFRDAVAMRDLSPELSARLIKSGTGENAWNLAYHATGSFFRPISADDGQSGPRPHISLIDEVHEHRNGYVVDMLKAGQKSRRQPLMFMITNSGTDKRTVCWDYHDYGGKVAAGQIADDSFFAYICALDDGDDPFRDEKCWIKANPSLPAGLPGMRYLREQVTQARGMPGRESTVRRLNFCQWVEAEQPWISSDVWFGCQDDFALQHLAGRRCWGGLDLSSTQDLTAFAVLFEPTVTDNAWRLLVWFWLPGDGLFEKADKDRVPYLAWRDAGHLTALQGRAINKLDVIRQVAEIAAQTDMQGIAYDRWRIEDLTMLIEQEGVTLPPLKPYGQGYKDMAPAVDEFERMLLNKTLRHNGNPVMTWCAANAVVVTDPAGNRKVAKERATGRVDGVVAGIMAVGLTLMQGEQEPVVGIAVF